MYLNLKEIFEPLQTWPLETARTLTYRKFIVSFLYGWYVVLIATVYDIVMNYIDLYI